MKTLFLTKNEHGRQFLSWPVGVWAAAVAATVGFLLLAGAFVPSAAAEQPPSGVSASPSDQPVAVPVTPVKPVPTVETASTTAPAMCCCRPCTRHRGRFLHCRCRSCCCCLP